MNVKVLEVILRRKIRQYEDILSGVNIESKLWHEYKGKLQEVTDILELITNLKQ